MTESMATAESCSENLGRREVFVMGYHPDEPGVLQAWDTEPESDSSETQREVCMAEHTTGDIGGPSIPNTDCEPPAIRPEGNQPSAGLVGASRPS